MLIQNIFTLILYYYNYIENSVNQINALSTLCGNVYTTIYIPKKNLIYSINRSLRPKDKDILRSRVNRLFSILLDSLLL